MLETRRLTTTPPGRRPEGPSDDEVLGFARAKEPVQALKLLFKRDGRVVFQRCALVLRDAALAEDVMQRVFIEASEALATFRGESDLRSWLLGIANHRALDALRHRQREEGHLAADPAPLALVPDLAPGADEALHRRRVEAALRECLDGLSPEAQLALHLRFHEGLTYEQAEGQTRMKADTLRARVVRALPSLRECLEGKGFLR